MLEETIEDKTLTLEERNQARQVLQFLTQTQNPRLSEVVEVRNDTAALMVDIKIDKSLDSVNAQQEQFEFIMQYAVDGEMDILDKLELSTISGKDELIEKIKTRRAQQQEAQQAEIQEEKQLVQAERVSKIQERTASTGKVEAETVDTQMSAVTKQLENIILANSPPDKEPQVSV